MFTAMAAGCQAAGSRPFTAWPRFCKRDTFWPRLMSGSMSEFRTIGIITKPDDPAVGDTVRALLTYLEDKQVSVEVDQSAAALVRGTGHTTISRKELARRCDLAIVVGGDGTLLNAARSLVEARVPIVGVNRGRLGFLVDVSPEAMLTQLEEILSGRYREETRFLLKAQVRLNGELVSETHAFNEVVIHGQGLVRVIELETRVNGQFLNHLRSDGLIVSTPTGSTAYALSGGGPILHPGLEAIVLVPICPHTLSYRPIVVDAASEIQVQLHPSNNSPGQISVDGQPGVELTADDIILITRKQESLRLIQPEDHDYFAALRYKLRWSEQL